MALYTFSTKPIYESMAQIRVDPSQQGSLGLEELMSQKFSADDDVRLQTEATILQSAAVCLQVIRELDLAHQANFAGKKMAAGIGSSDPVKMSPENREALLKRFRQDETIEVLTKTRVIEIRFRNPDPKLATDTVNAILDAYLQRNFQSRYEGTMQVSQWLAKQMQELKVDALAAQQKLADFQKERNLLGADEHDNIVSDRLRQLNQQLTDAEADRIVKEARYRLAKSGNPELVAAVVPSTTLQVLRTQEAELKAQNVQLDAKFGSAYPKVREVQAQLTGLNHAIAAEVANVGQRLQDEYLAAGKSENMLRGQLEAQKQEAFKLNESAVQYATLKHKVESSQDLYDTLQLKLKEAGVMAGLASADISIVDRGMIPSDPIFPKKMLMLPLGLFGGLFGGVVLAFVLESLDDTLQTSEEVEAVSSLPALAVVPLATPSHSQRNGGRSATPRLMEGGLAAVAAQQPDSMLAEAYRVVCNALLLASVDRPPRLLVVTSALTQEGKSITSCNLAIALAQRGNRVLLVDADLRRSTLEAQLGMEPKAICGLSSLLAGATEPEAVKKLVTGVPNLELIPAGPRTPCPAELLASNKMKSLLERWSAEYDHVVVNTAPVLFVADTLPLAAKADAVVLVVRSGQSRMKALTRMCDLLDRANAHVIGVIVNGADLKLKNYYLHPYHNHNYRSYCGDGNEIN